MWQRQRKELKSALCRPFAAETWQPRTAVAVQCRQPESMTSCMCCELNRLCKPFGTLCIGYWVSYTHCQDFVLLDWVLPLEYKGRQLIFHFTLRPQICFSLYLCISITYIGQALKSPSPRLLKIPRLISLYRLFFTHKTNTSKLWPSFYLLCWGGNSSPCHLSTPF